MAARLNPKYRRQLFGRLRLPDAAQKRREANHVAAARSLDRKIAPQPGARVDAEGAEMAIGAARIESDELGARRAATVRAALIARRAPLGSHGRSRSGGLAVERVCAWRALPLARGPRRGG